MLVRFQHRRGAIARRLMQVGGYKFHSSVVEWFQRGVGVVINGGIENRAAELIAVRRNICAATGQAESQRRSGTNQHAVPQLSFSMATGIYGEVQSVKTWRRQRDSRRLIILTSVCAGC